MLRSLLPLILSLVLSVEAKADHSLHVHPIPPAEGAQIADQDSDDDIYLGGKVFPNTPLITHEGKEVRFFDDLVKGKVVALNFVFTSCGNSCPLETARLKRVQSLLAHRMGKDIFFYSISIDPETDTPEVLSAYRKKFDIGPGWTFLTGKKQDIDGLQKKLGIYIDQSKGKPRPDHSLSLIIGNQKTGQWLRRSNMDNAQVLAHNIERLHPEQPKTALQEYSEAPVKVEGYSRGLELYLTRCIDCHSIGKGDGIGPDLKDVTRVRDRKWLTRWIKEPDIMLEQKDPLAISLLEKFQQIPMPNLRLNDNDVKAIIEYLADEAMRLDKQP